MLDHSPTRQTPDPVHRLLDAILRELLRPLDMEPEALSRLSPRPELSTPPSPDLGDLSLACFPLAKALRRSPAEVAGRIAGAHREGIAASTLAASDGAGAFGPGAAAPPAIEEVSAAGPYVNLRFAVDGLASWLMPTVISGAPPFGRNLPPTGIKTMVEYSAPNTNKPLHLGHVRNNVLGMSLSNILEATGDDVVRVNLVNDRGIHICKSMIAYRRWGGGKSPEDAGMKPDHFVGSFYTLFDQELKKERSDWEARGAEGAASGDDDAFLAESELMREARRCLIDWEAEDAATRTLWEKMNVWVYEGFRQTYDRMGCRFDHWYHESDTYRLGKDVVEDGLARGVFYKKDDGSVWARLSDVGLQDKILLRSDGTSVYITQDLGTAIRKFEDFGIDRSLYVVGSEQIQHFENLFAILKMMGFPWAEGCRHVSYGLVTLPRGMGRLKSREGRSVDADTLLDELHDLAARKIEEAIAEGKLDRDEVGDPAAAAERVGQAALKIYLLQVGSEKNIVYDPDATLSFVGDTGPAIQYSHARIHGILRKGLARGDVSPGDVEESKPFGIMVRDDLVDPSLLRDPHERALLLRIMGFPGALESSARTLSPSHVANGLLELTKTFARFYHNCPVLRAGSKALVLARLQLCLVTGRVLRRGLGLLTAEAPERM
jgi:arginyl-tRNA synthetase